MKTFCVVLLSLYGAFLGDNISPTLSPESDEKFMRDDYPSDARPAHLDHPDYHPLVSKFTHPYPAVQDSEDYDKDYTKDENDDNGEWRAQTEYDMLKNKLAKELDDVRKATAAEKAARAEYESSVKSQEEAERLAKEAERKALEAANMEPDDPSDKKWGIRPAIEKVEAETIDLEKCRKELEAARKRLAELQAKLAKAEEAHAVAVADHKEKRAFEIVKETDEAHKEKSLAEEQREYDIAKKDYEEQKKELDQAERDLAKYEERLRVFRSKVDEKGGIYRIQPPPEPKKASARAGATVSTAAFVIVSLIAAH